MKSPIIKLTNRNEQIQLHRIMYAMGYTYNGESDIEIVVQNSLTQMDVDAYPLVYLNIPKKIISAYSKNHNIDGRCILFNTIGEFIQYALDNHDKKPIEVKLNSDYTATVSFDSVQVGCQTFELDVIQKLYDAMLQVKKESGK